MPDYAVEMFFFCRKWAQLISQSIRYDFILYLESNYTTYLLLAKDMAIFN